MVFQPSRPHGILMVLCTLLLGVCCILQGCVGSGNGGIFAPSPAPLPDANTKELFIPDGTTCGDCAVVWNTDAAGYTCGDRIDWLKRHGKSENDAKIQVCINEFPHECGDCCSEGSSNPSPSQDLRYVQNPPQQPLQRCQGDCDNDEECAGALKCFQRDHLEPVPGCSGSGQSVVDYCYSTDEAPETPTPTPAQTPSPFPAPPPGACNTAQVIRRRRAAEICVCRRRTASTCQNDQVQLPGAANQAIKVMSYNLFGWNAFNQNTWRGDNVMKKIKAWDPAVLGAQEVETGGGKGGDVVAATITSTIGISSGYGGQFFKSSVVEKHDTKWTNLKSGYWMSMTKYKHKSTGAYFLFFNSHWKHGYGSEQSATVAEAIHAERQKHGSPPTVLVGDFNQFCNAHEGSALKYLKGEEGSSPVVFEDLISHDKAGSYGNGDCRIDFILGSKGQWTVRQSDIDRDGMGENDEASDHAALMAELLPK